MVLDLPIASDGALPCDMTELLALDGAPAEAAALCRAARQDRRDLNPRAFTPLADAHLLAPVPRPGKVICLGLNYAEHAAEGGGQVPAEPIVFCKASSSVVGPGEAIRLPGASGKVDYEAELAVVIGRRARGVSARDALGFVAGYTVLNDVSARDYQHEKTGKNSADIRLVVDAMELSYAKEHIDTFVIVSGDSDFTPLVGKLKENGKTVIGLGMKESTSDLLAANCDEFIYYEDLTTDRHLGAHHR
jgi:2-keto-4-pentenoate hydratase/2-oxohepta-3-ene-1,7-dioic acid hydratase in catechol pathway